ncbi:tyrosine-type recombinase/integrase [Pseudohongiella sp.]|uniref:Tyr recombinase domain-containing protein n=1 Tax=marine sediment metagenome TaxID=412755 RepID=A0A0F9W2S4_9ZZZZ|nr:tyrosine-type recombinase/integrase [Pseudohongiella sp.]HDZ09201.1 integrase [Pseudohongiella sp.]
MAKAQAKITSISDAAAHQFLKEAGERDVLSCKRIPGLSLIKLKKGGSWRWRYTDPTGKRRVATLGSYNNMKPVAAAQTVLDLQSNDVDPLQNKQVRRIKAQDAAREAEARTLRHYLDNYYRPHMERSWKADNAKANYNRIAGHFADLLDRDMATIDKIDINKWQLETEKNGRAYSTVRRNFGALKTMIRRAVKDGVLDSDPLANHKLLEPTLKDQHSTRADPGKSERRLLSNEEIHGVLTGLDAFAEELRRQRRSSRAHGKPELSDLDDVNYPHWFIPFCHLGLHTGLRPGDLYSITWQELNLSSSRLTKVCEKTSHAIRREKKPAVVDMRLNTTIKAVLVAWWADQGKPSTGLVFPSPKTGRQLDVQAHRRPWTHVKLLGGLADELNFYAFRHHFISAMLAAGVPVFTVAKLAGHKGVEMILQHYGHLCPDQAVEALDIVASTIACGSSIPGGAVLR